MGSEVEKELDDRWWLGLRGRALEAVDPQDFIVVLSFGGNAVLTIEAAASVRAVWAPRTETAGVAQSDDGTVSTTEALLALVGRRVLSSVGFKDGDLRLVFDSGRLLGVAHGERHEAWQLIGPSGRMWVSLAGGGLATFPA